MTVLYGRCRHGIGEPGSTVEIRYFEGADNVLWFAGCWVCGAHTGLRTTMRKAKEDAANGYFQAGPFF